ncbi:hypothetical protein Y1Q_0022625 [Alligator mississippiensis]|uniref:Uncharacterized protein n=1 Tax=Alligator mississippiensis TaxID=8496 RepID=A0A151PH39_ALLMI|nr:hypothetical protein Y1Q_0022625 [Alligator mississippiensis]
MQDTHGDKSHKLLQVGDAIKCDPPTRIWPSVFQLHKFFASHDFHYYCRLPPSSTPVTLQEPFTCSQGMCPTVSEMLSSTN